MQNTTLTPRYRLPGGFLIDGATLLRALLLLALFAVLLGVTMHLPAQAADRNHGHSQYGRRRFVGKKIAYTIIFIIRVNGHWLHWGKALLTACFPCLMCPMMPAILMAAGVLP